MSQPTEKDLERAREIVTQYHVFPEKSQPEIEAIAQALTEARSEERERAAKIAEQGREASEDKEAWEVAFEIAKAIRDAGA